MRNVSVFAVTGIPFVQRNVIRALKWGVTRPARIVLSYNQGSLVKSHTRLTRQKLRGMERTRATCDGSGKRRGNRFVRQLPLYHENNSIATYDAFYETMTEGESHTKKSGKRQLLRKYLRLKECEKETKTTSLLRFLLQTATTRFQCMRP